MRSFRSIPARLPQPIGYVNGRPVYQIAGGAPVDRSSAGALIPEDLSKEIIQFAVQKSVALQLFSRATMSQKQQRMPVLAALPQASFVNPRGGDTDIGIKPITTMLWKNKYLNAEPLAAIVPVPTDVLDDVASGTFDLWGEIKPRISEAIGKAIDAAVFFGAGAPDTWPASIFDGASAAGQLVTVGDSTVDLAEDINMTMALVEQWGYEITGHGAAPTLKASLRGLRNSQGTPIFVSSLRSDGGQDFSVYGYPTTFFKNGSFDPTKASLITGDYQQGIMAMRQDLTFKILDEATLYDTDGVTPLYALAQQDMVALRVVCRPAFQIANPITPLHGPGWSPTGNGTDTYPFAVLQPA